MTVLAGIVIAGYAIIAPALPATPVGDAVGGSQERPASRTSNLVRNLSIPIALSFGLGIHQATVVTFLTLYLVDSSGVSPVQAATSFAVLSLGGAVGRVVWGWISDRFFGGRRALVLATSAILAALMAFAVGQLPSALTGTSGHILIGTYGFVSQGWVGISRAWGVELAGPGLSGRAGGLLLGSMMTGGLIGPIIFGNLVEWRGGYTDAWSLLGLSTLIVGLLALRSGLQAESQHGASHAVGD
jgi:sugar phosphate permease